MKAAKSILASGLIVSFIFFVMGALAIAQETYELAGGKKMELKGNQAILIDKLGFRSVAKAGTYRLKNGGFVTVDKSGRVVDSKLVSEETEKGKQPAPLQPDMSRRVTSYKRGQEPGAKGAVAGEKKRGKGAHFKARLADGTRMKVVGNKLYVLGKKKGKLVVAKKGTYRLENGKIIKTNNSGVILYRGKPVDSVGADGVIVARGKRVGTLGAETPRSIVEKVLGQPEEGGAKKTPEKAAVEAKEKLKKEAGEAVERTPGKAGEEAVSGGAAEAKEEVTLKGAAGASSEAKGLKAIQKKAERKEKRIKARSGESPDQGTTDEEK